MRDTAETLSVKFYLVDDVPVCVWNDGVNVRGFVLTTGHPYSPLKAASEGKEIALSEVLGRLA